MYQPLKNEIFHVHTWRCKHASDHKDYEYIEKAIDMDASRIVFTDHCPFPGNPFRGRMDMEQLGEYISSLSQLKKEYGSKIDIKIGLETEYLPSFHDYYLELVKIEEIDLLALGQHMFEHEDGRWSFEDDDKSKEYIGLCNAIINGIKTGFFDVVVHPDRSFRRCNEWTLDMERMAIKVIKEAKEHNIWLEQNYSSMCRKRNYWEQFWNQKAINNSIYGYDAHAIEEIVKKDLRV